MWQGAAAVCVNETRELLMVLQGKSDEEKKWSVPAGGKLARETFEDCCVREVWEETGYQVHLNRLLFKKEEASSAFPDLQVLVYYFEAEIVGGNLKIQDPDGLIHQIDWIPFDQLASLTLAFPEDREFLLQFIAER